MSNYYLGDVTDKAKVCPFCGEHDAALFRIERYLRDWFFVHCVSCGAQAPKALAEKTAVANWNRRKDAKND
jgi:Lar family restriction alleviation protein